MNYTISSNGNGQNVNLSIDCINISLEDATSIIDRILKNPKLSSLDKQLLDMIYGKNCDPSLLMAVKHCKEVTGKGLKESKDYCDELKAKNLNY